MFYHYPGHVCHIIRNRRSALLSACLARMAVMRACVAKPQIWKFHVALWQTTSETAPKSVPHVQHDYFSSFNQSNHCFVALSWSLLSSFLKLPIYNYHYVYLELRARVLRPLFSSSPKLEANSSLIHRFELSFPLMKDQINLVLENLDMNTWHAKYDVDVGKM